LFPSQKRLVRSIYYTALFEVEERSLIRLLLDWIDDNGYTLVNKPAKELADPSAVFTMTTDADTEDTASGDDQGALHSEPAQRIGSGGPILMLYGVPVPRAQLG